MTTRRRRSDSSLQTLLAGLAMVAMLGTQYVWPLSLAVAQSLPAPKTTAPAAAAPATKSATKPAAKRTRRVVGTVPLKARGIASAAACADCAVSMRRLDLSRPPSEKELRMAGQLGGALSPLESADTARLSFQLDRDLKQGGIPAGLAGSRLANQPAGRAVNAAHAKIERLQAINLSFGQAMQEWNSHNYRVAAGMMAEHLHQFPDSPWAGEAMLHLGCDAKYNGRFSEAAQRYAYLLAHTSGDANQPSFEIHQKAMLRQSDLNLALGRWSEAGAGLLSIVQNDRDWRRRTWARDWLYMVHLYQHSARKLRACGTRALSSVFAELGKDQAAQRLAHLTPKSAEGYSLAELAQLAGQNGLPMRGFRGHAADLASLPLPVVIHYDFHGSSTEDPAARVSTNRTARVSKRGSPAVTARRDSLAAAPLADARGSVGAGHFLVVQSVDAAHRQVALLDPQNHRHYRLSFAALDREWSGNGLVRLPPAPASPAAPRRVALLSDREMAKVIGGCCGNPTWIPGMGCGGPKKDIKGSCTGSCHGEPAVMVDRRNMNVFVHDVPLWYSPPVGPAVEFAMSFNNWDALNLNTVMGSKWSFSYGTYLIEDTGDGGGVVTLFMPDGKEDNYYPNQHLLASGYQAYDAQPGVFNHLIRVNRDRWELVMPQGDKYIYDCPNGAQQAFLVEVRDRWGYSLNIAYNSDVHPVTITDAVGQVTTLTYSGDHITRVDDPFGRHANFSYDEAGDLIEAVDMEGQAFQYHYSAGNAYGFDPLLSELDTAQGNWTFTYHDVQVRTTFALTVTDPAGQQELLQYSGIGSGFDIPYQYTDTAKCHDILSPRADHATLWVVDVLDLAEPEVFTFQTAHQQPGTEGNSVPDPDVTRMDYDQDTALPTGITDPSGHTATISYNPGHAVQSVTGMDGYTTSLTYGSGNVHNPFDPIWQDPLSVSNANGTLATYQYNSYHQPVLITDAVSGSAGAVSLTYTSWGAPSTVTGPLGTVVYNYGGNFRLQSVAFRGSGGGTPVTLASFTYDSIGRVYSSTDASGITLGYHYDNLDHVTRVDYPDGTYSSTDYVCCGIPGKVRDRAGRVTFYDYDQLKRVTRIQDNAGNHLQMGYDLDDNLVRLVDSEGRITRWTYDYRDRCASKIYPDGRDEEYSYNRVSDLVSVRDELKRVTKYSYDTARAHQLTGIDYPTAADISLSYDNVGQVHTVTDGLGTSTYGYDLLGRVTSVDGPWANDTLTFHYDTAGRTDWRKLNNADELDYGYDGMGRLGTVTAAANTPQVYTYHYSGNTSQLTKLDLPNGTSRNYSYDSLLRLTGASNQTASGGNISSYAYAYDTRDIVTAMERQVGTGALQHVDYTYDSVDQLKTETSTETPNPLLQNSFDYDAMGNRTGLTVGSGTGAPHYGYTANKLNQISDFSVTGSGVTASSGTLAYDADGNLTGGTVDGVTSTAYSYDDLDRLTSITLHDPTTGANTHKSEFVYDGGSRKCIDREYDWDAANNGWGTPTETRYVYDGMDVVQERDGNNNVLVSYTRVGNIGGLLCRTVKGQNGDPDAHYYYDDDGHGNVTGLTDDSGAAVASYAYDAYGNTLSATGAQAVANPYRYSSKAFHSPSGLYDYGCRFYSPTIGRWLNRDPLAESGGLNLYQFVSNDPVNIRDNYGLDAGWAQNPCPDDPYGEGIPGGGPLNHGGWPTVPFAGSLPAVAGTRWKLGEPIDKPNRSGTTPDWETIRKRFWKNEANSNPDEYSDENLDRMRRGSAEQRINPESGELESRELHHDPPQRSGGTVQVKKVWPEEHAAVDPFRRMPNAPSASLEEPPAKIEPPLILAAPGIGVGSGTEGNSIGGEIPPP